MFIRECSASVTPTEIIPLTRIGGCGCDDNWCNDSDDGCKQAYYCGYD